MASDANELKNSRWGNPRIVYTRKRRKIRFEDPNNAAGDSGCAAAPEVSVSGEGNDVLRRSSPEKSPENGGGGPPEEVEPRLNDSRAGPEGDEARVVGPEDGDNRGGSPVVGPDNGDIRGGSPVVGPDNGDVGSGGPLEESRDGVVRGRGDEVAKPVISRVENRVRINLGGTRSRDEVRDLRRTLEGELDQIRSLYARVEAAGLELTANNNVSNNGGFSNAGRISSVLGGGGGVNAFSYPRNMDNNSVIESRPLVRANPEVGSVGHPEPRPFLPPRLAVVENNNGVAEFMEKEKRTPKANQLYRNSEFLLGKDRLPPESNKKVKANGGGRKHGFESDYGYPFGFGFGFDKHRVQVFKKCSNLLQRVMKHKHGWVFNQPVDVEAMHLHDYFDIIKNPMDLGTIKTRLSQNWYKTPWEFAEDVRLVFSNAMTYNPVGHDVHVMATQLLKIFDDRWAVIEAECNPDWRQHQMYHDVGLPTPPSRKTPHPSPFVRASVTSHVTPPAPQVTTLDRSQSMTLDRPQSMTRPADFRPKPSRGPHVGRTPVPKKPKANEPNKRDMTYEEKQRLSTNLQNLPSERLDAVVQIIKKRNSSLSQHDDEIEVDIDSVDAETLWELDRFVTNYRKNLSKKKRKIEIAMQRAGDVHSSAAIMNSARLVADALKKGGSGENNTGAPATNAEAGKQVDNASRSSSSSSSSSDSGSSSSDSDSDSSSGDESETEAGRSPKT